MVDRKDYANYKNENFPIWRIDASRLLQKFEPVPQDDKSLLYKSLSTVSMPFCCSIVFSKSVPLIGHVVLFQGVKN